MFYITKPSNKQKFCFGSEKQNNALPKVPCKHKYSILSLSLSLSLFLEISPLHSIMQSRIQYFFPISNVSPSQFRIFFSLSYLYQRSFLLQISYEHCLYFSQTISPYHTNLHLLYSLFHTIPFFFSLVDFFFIRFPLNLFVRTFTFFYIQWVSGI